MIPSWKSLELIVCAKWRKTTLFPIPASPKSSTDSRLSSARIAAALSSMRSKIAGNGRGRSWIGTGRTLGRGCCLDAAESTIPPWTEPIRRTCVPTAIWSLSSLCTRVSIRSTNVVWLAIGDRLVKIRDELPLFQLKSQKPLKRSLGSGQWSTRAWRGPPWLRSLARYGVLCSLGVKVLAQLGTPVPSWLTSSGWKESVTYLVARYLLPRDDRV